MTQTLLAAGRQSSNGFVPIHAVTHTAFHPSWERQNALSSRAFIIRSVPPLASDALAQTYRDRGYQVEFVSADAPRDEILKGARNSHITVAELRSDDAEMFELCEWLRQHWTGPLVILTSAFSKTDAPRIYQMGADAYFPYPCNMRVVMAHSEALLRRSQGKVRRPFG